jgi:hypothetical protein
MVLGCVALLTLALMMVVSFSIANAVHEKIRVQSHADAAAYSLATVEARALNSTAFYNRAIAATLVAQTALHAWAIIAMMDVQLFYAGMVMMGEAMGMEIAEGCYPWNPIHCPCVAVAGYKLIRFMMAGSDWADKLQGKESDFNDAVDDLRTMGKDLYKEEQSLLSRAKTELMNFMGPMSVLGSLKDANAPQSDYVMQVLQKNPGAFACALEGSDFDDDCTDSSHSKSSIEERSRIIQNAANAARGPFQASGLMAGADAATGFMVVNPSEPMDIAGSGTWTHSYFGRTRVGVDHTNSNDSGDKAVDVGGSAIGAAALMGWTAIWHSLPVLGSPIYAGLWSDDQGGDQTAAPGVWSKGFDGAEDKFKGGWSEDPCGESNCFVNFRALNDKDKDFGQPTVYAAVTQDLRSVSRTANHGKWEINSDAKVNVQMMADKEVSLSFAPRKKGTAIAKAKVYFHQLGSWQQPPNLFDPFWRAKLHFFKKSEAQDILQLSMDSDGVQMINGGAPVEGVVE